jgi:hypothetical protein
MKTGLFTSLITIRLMSIGVLLTTLCITQLFAAAQRDEEQKAIARQLLSGDMQERNRVLDAVKAIRPEKAAPELRSALIALLERQNLIVEQADSAGLDLSTLDDPEVIASVHHAVAALNDPKAIPALARALGWFTVVRALAKFGDQAAPAVIAIVASPKTRYTAVDDGLRVLRFMVETRQDRPLSASTMDQIRRVVRQRLSGEQYFTTLWYSIDLAGVLDDSTLRRVIGDLATYPSEVVARGIVDPALIEQTQKRAADRLAGVRSEHRECSGTPGRTRLLQFQATAERLAHRAGL